MNVKPPTTRESLDHRGLIEKVPIITITIMMLQSRSLGEASTFMEIKSLFNSSSSLLDPARQVLSQQWLRDDDSKWVATLLHSILAGRP